MADASSVDRPFVYVNMAMTVDGKITSAARDHPRFTSVEDRRNMDRLRAEADAILVGAGTLRADNPRLHVRDTEMQAYRRSLGKGRGCVRGRGVDHDDLVTAIAKRCQACQALSDVARFIPSRDHHADAQESIRLRRCAHQLGSRLFHASCSRIVSPTRPPPTVSRVWFPPTTSRRDAVAQANTSREKVRWNYAKRSSNWVEG